MADWPEQPLMEGPPGAVTRIDGKDYLYFGGTDYLGLSGHIEVVEAACVAVRRYGVHPATSRSGFGNSPSVLEVERRAAEFFGSEAAFYYPSGYAGGSILTQALADRAELVMIDESAHFSLEEAGRLLPLPVVPFRHGDSEDLRRKLHEFGGPAARPLLLTDGVFSLTGDLAPIDRYLDVLRCQPLATVLVDDAHGVGTIGANGRGTLEHFGLPPDRINGDPAEAGGQVSVFACGTLSKAIGGYGGILPCSRAMLQRVRQTTHYYEGASPPTSADAAATAKALEIAIREPLRRERLRRNTDGLRAGLRSLGLAVEDWPTPIIALTIGGSENMRRIHKELRRAGIIVPYFAAYSGSGAGGRLRIAVFATHTDEMIDRLVMELGRLLSPTTKNTRRTTKVAATD